MKKVQKNERGITLIALIITVIVIVILAAVSIRAITNMKIVDYAVNGAQNYVKAGKEENAIYDKIIGIIDLGTGSYYTETKTINGEKGTSYNPTIPKGFRPVNTEGANWTDGGNMNPSTTSVNNGLVIEDADGNQFVWVPCTTTGEEGLVSYAQDKQYNDGTTASKQWYYTVIPSGYDGAGTAITDWTDAGAGAYEMTIAERIASVAQYGGFYVARYEAGVPSDADFYASQEGETYYDASKKNAEGVLTLKPVSKQGNASWNLISQEKSIKVARNMYGSNKTTYGVTSNLIDSYAWDTIVNWMNADDRYKTGNSGIAIDSSSKGNYYNSNTYSLSSNGLYAIWRYNEAKTNSGASNGWTYPKTYKKGSLALGANSITSNDTEKYEFTGYDFDKYNYTTRKEIATGTLNVAKVKNIYDMAGNMYEWTTETGKHNGTSSSFAVLRGGSFHHYSSDGPVSYRYGNYRTTDYNVNVGFRVVLYL